MFDHLKKFKRMLIIIITIMMGIVLLLSTIELCWVIINDILSPPVFLLEINELLEIFGMFMLVIIGIELFETIMKTYLTEGYDHAQIVLSVAIIAIARKVIILDVKEIPSLTLFGIGIIILALSIGYYLIKKCN